MLSKLLGFKLNAAIMGIENPRLDTSSVLRTQYMLKQAFAFAGRLHFVDGFLQHPVQNKL